jgi:hypothetical protein
MSISSDLDLENCAQRTSVSTQNPKFAQICSNGSNGLRQRERERERERERTGASKAQAKAIKSRPRTPLSRVLTTNKNKIKGDFADFIQVNMQRICKLIPPGDQDQT